MGGAVPRKNLEIKARCSDLAAARIACQHLGATLEGIQIQIDTYFQVPCGRLKLREIEGQEAVLIWYDRPDQAATRLSSYYLTPVSEPALLAATLQNALGLRGRVHKQREIHHFHQVRIHLDEVTDLGTFLELEAVLSGEADEAAAWRHLEQLRTALALNEAMQLAGSYADLLGI